MTETKKVVGGPDESVALMDVKAVAKLLDCSRGHVYRLSDSGKMPRPLKLGQLVRWRRVAIENWIEAGCPSCRTARRAGR